MNAFVRHHQSAIAFSYSCFDRSLCNGYIQYLPWGGSVVSFLRDRCQLRTIRRALNKPEYKLSQLRYELAKLRRKGLVARVVGTQRYELSPEGYRLAVLYQKFYHRLYGPLTAGIVEPVADDARIPQSRQARLDRLYQAVDKALRALSERVGVVA